MEAARLDPDGGEWPSVPGALEAGDTGPDGGHAIRRPEIPGHGDARPGEHEGPDDSGAGCFEGTRPGRTEGPGHPGAREHERAEGHGDPGARSCQGHGDPGARSCQGHGDPGARVCQGNGDPGARVCQGNGDPGARVCQGNGDPGARVCQGNGDPGARVCQGNGDPGARVCQGNGDPGARVCQGNGDPGARVRQGHGDPGTRVRQGHGDPGARVRQGHGDPGARVRQGHGDPGARVCQGHGDPGARVCQGHGDPGARVCQGHGDPGARVCQGHGDPGARVCQGHGDPGARVCQGHGDPGARVCQGHGDPRSGEGPGDRVDEGPRDQYAGSHEGPRIPSPRSHEGPRCPSPRSHEGPRCPSPRSNEESGDSGTGIDESPRRPSEKPELPRDRTNENTNAPRDRSAEQRVFGSGGTERTHAPGTCGERRAGVHGQEGLDVPGTSRPTKCNDARTNAPAKQLRPELSKGDEPGTMDGPEDPRGAESFKKPVTPARTGWNEKTLEQRNPPPTPAQPPPSVSTGGAERETAKDLSARLPSDAYRASPAIPYREPPWAGLPEALYSLEVLKAGSILSNKSLTGFSWTVFGRLPGCHISLEHPSVSRHHAVLQYRSLHGTEPDEEPGFYVYDLGSTHGTFINKQRIQPKTYCRFRVGHVLKFGGSTRLFVLQGPDDDQDVESDLTVTQIKEARRQRENLQNRMLGDDSDDDDDDDEEEEELGEEEGRKEAGESGENSGCMWGMGEDALDEENDENPIALEFQEEHEALYLKNPKKALQGFFDREGEELEFEYDEPGPGSWVCRVTLPVEDSSGKQLVAEITHSGKKKDSAKLCALEACRMLEMRGLLRQEAVSRKRKAKQWEDEDFYDSDDDTFLDRTGIVEKKRLNRMKKAGKIGEKPETYESLTSKLGLVEKEITEIASQLKTTQTGEAQNSAQDSLDAFMTEIKARCALDSVTRKKLHLQSLELKKEQQRLKRLIKIVQPTKLPELKPSPPEQDPNTKKRTLPMFGAMKGGCKFKLKTGTVGKLPARRMDLPASLFIMKDDNNEPEEDDDDMQVGAASNSHSDTTPTSSDITEQSTSSDPGRRVRHAQVAEEGEVKKVPEVSSTSDCVQAPNTHKPPATPCEEIPKAAAAKPRKMQGPSRPPQAVLSTIYPEDDPDYCVWTPPAGQTGDGKTHLNEKYGY